MRRTVGLVSFAVLLLAACGQGESDTERQAAAETQAGNQSSPFEDDSDIEYFDSNAERRVTSADAECEPGKGWLLCPVPPPNGLEEAFIAFMSTEGPSGDLDRTQSWISVSDGAYKREIGVTGETNWSPGCRAGAGETLLEEMSVTIRSDPHGVVCRWHQNLVGEAIVTDYMWTDSSVVRGRIRVEEQVYGEEWPGWAPDTPHDIGDMLESLDSWSEQQRVDTPSTSELSEGWTFSDVLQDEFGSYEETPLGVRQCAFSEETQQFDTEDDARGAARELIEECRQILDEMAN